MTSKIKIAIAKRSEIPRRHSQSDAAPPMSMHAVSLLFEAIFLKTKSLQTLGNFKGGPLSSGFSKLLICTSFLLSQLFIYVGCFELSTLLLTNCAEV